VGVASNPRASSAQLPRVIGRYALYDRIAAGGMATVHLGRLLGPVGFARTVAIKRLHPHFAEDPEFVSMFLDEARLAARIRHPNVVPTLDVVAVEGELFLVMDYVQGESLSRLIRVAASRNGRMPPAMVATIMTGVLHGLHAAHEAKGERGEPLGIVHRDVSPQNVLVGTDGVARVLDFGVAKAAGRVQTTREGQLKGKLAYMAPEQIGGKVARTTDVYAASVVLWEALTGERLFVGESEAEVMKQVLKGRIVAPSQRAPDIPAALDAITMRGLDADPSKRFPTAGAMAVALEDCMPLVPASRIGKWVQWAAGEMLSQRSERIAAIESDSAMRAPSVPPAAPSARRVGDTPSSKRLPQPASGTSEGTAIVTDDMIIPTQLSSGSVSVAGHATSDAKVTQRRWLIGAAVGGGLLAVVVLLVLNAALRGRPASEPPSGATQPSAPPPTSDSTVVAPAPPLAASSAAPPPPSASVVSLATATTPSPFPARPFPVVRPTAPVVTKPPSPGCNPPYYLDKDGVTRVFKKECL